MTALANYLADALLNHCLRGTQLAAPSTLYVGLSSTATTDAGAYTEPSGNGYSRVAIPCTTGQWNAPATSSTLRRITNINPVTFPTASGGNWGTMTHCFIADAASAGNVFWHGALTASVVINNGQAYAMGAGQLAPNFANNQNMTEYLMDALLNHCFRGTAFTLPTTLYAGLSTAATTAAGGYTELSGNNYARVSYACSTGNWEAPADAGSNVRRTRNDNAITWPTASAGWSAASHLFLIDTASGAGNVHWHGALSSSVTVGNGQAFSLPADALAITLT